MLYRLPTEPTRGRLVLGWLMLGLALAAGFFLMSYLPYIGLGLLVIGVLRLRAQDDTRENEGTEPNPQTRRLWQVYVLTGVLLLVASFVLVLALNPPP